jgi:cytochrome c-type biogenesis protein CcmH
MVVLAYLIFGALALAAAAFVTWPILRRQDESIRARLLLGGAAAALVLGIGGGAYLMLGNPYLATRSLAGPSTQDLRGLVALLAQRVRARPSDPRAWTLLGRGYLTLGDATDAAAAFRRGIGVAPLGERPQLYSAYGEALTLAAGGTVTGDAEAAFALALRGNPKDFAARYYLGVAFAARSETQHALALWNSLLADAPPNAPWRAGLVDRIALLSGRPGVTPDIMGMVASLAARLKAQPNDPAGWQRLVRAYSVLGDAAKAKQALTEARTALKRDRTAQAQLALEARELKLEK